jgi:hypothetical protein
VNLKAVAATLAAVAALAAVTGCSADTPDAPATTGTAAATHPLLSEHGLIGKDATTIIDALDRMPVPDRPTDLMASVRPNELVLADGDDEVTLPIPANRFYLSLAPYVDQTHDCFHHSLTTCKGELGDTDVHVKILDTASGKALVDRTVTTFDNGFVGFWLPRNIDGTVQVSYDGKTGRTAFGTDDDAPTCLTTLKLT